MLNYAANMVVCSKYGRDDQFFKRIVNVKCLQFSLCRLERSELVFDIQNTGSF